MKELNLLGINMHNNGIYMIESNNRTVKDYEVQGFAKVLDISICNLYMGIEDKLEK